MAEVKEKFVFIFTGRPAHSAAMPVLFYRMVPLPMTFNDP